jgi:hypothetical protein
MFIFMPQKRRQCNEKSHLSTIPFHFDMNVALQFWNPTKSKSEIQIQIIQIIHQNMAWGLRISNLNTAKIMFGCNNKQARRTATSKQPLANMDGKWPLVEGSGN